MPIKIMISFAALLLLTGCASEVGATHGVRQIVSTTSFGMCVGYCTTRLEISEGQAVLARESRGGRGAQVLPAQRFSTVLAPSEWQEFERLARSTDLGALPSVIGCPDCADGGAETLSIANARGQQSVSFDYGATIEQAQPLLERVRAMRARLTPE